MIKIGPHAKIKVLGSDPNEVEYKELLEFENTSGQPLIVRITLEPDLQTHLQTQIELLSALKKK